MPPSFSDDGATEPHPTNPLAHITIWNHRINAPIGISSYHCPNRDAMTILHNKNTRESI